MDKSQCTRKFECDNGRTYLCHPRSCFFCEHCVEIIWDYTNGPYMFPCDADGDTHIGLQGECDKFKEGS